MEQGTPVRIKATRAVGSFVSDVGNGKILMDVPVERPKYARLNEDTNETEYFGDRTIATIERIEINLSDIEINFEEEHEQYDERSGHTWLTNQHGEEILGSRRKVV